jgi:hypothetical protein
MAEPPGVEYVSTERTAGGESAPESKSINVVTHAVLPVSRPDLVCVCVCDCDAAVVCCVGRTMACTFGH